MEVKVVKSEGNELKIEISDFTVCEFLRNELWKDEKVVLASYSRKHPTAAPVLRIVAEGKTPKKALEDAIGRAAKVNEEFLKVFKAAK